MIKIIDKINKYHILFVLTSKMTSGVEVVEKKSEIQSIEYISDCIRDVLIFNLEDFSVRFGSPSVDSEKHSLQRIRDYINYSTENSEKKEEIFKNFFRMDKFLSNLVISRAENTNLELFYEMLKDTARQGLNIYKK